jgi:hypothetical protein
MTQGTSARDSDLARQYPPAPYGITKLCRLDHPLIDESHHDQFLTLLEGLLPRLASHRWRGGLTYQVWSGGILKTWLGRLADDAATGLLARRSPEQRFIRSRCERVRYYSLELPIDGDTLNRQKFYVSTTGDYGFSQRPETPELIAAAFETRLTRRAS